ncbi:MAG TPA: FAD-dependent monooxygenase [Bacteroidia bacterium]|jgi:2-polyprenyl-6-methoxyphenol hydroxylase-like FAD-dependent oxidoreductase|nr:FAD-dependent monooxygenase [Bacteroidia bacterium]
MKKTALISGASIAGLTLAYWLNRYGYKVTVVEISAGLKKGGSPVDIRGDALDVVERMGILEKIRSVRLITTIEFVNAQNECAGILNGLGKDESGKDIELHRNHLIEIIRESAGPDIEYLFGNSIQTIVQDDDKVKVAFKDGQKRNFDFLFGADGVHSAVRKLVFGAEQNFNHFCGAYFAILNVDENMEGRNAGRMYSIPGKMAGISEKGNSILLFRSPKLDYDYRNTRQHKRILEENFSGYGWQIPGILKAMADSDNLYFDEICQIKMPLWTDGRIALVGDAAYCAGFPTGMGSSLAIQGASLLADAIVKSADYKIAFQKYNETLRPVVEQSQAIVYAGLSFLLPETQEAIDERNKGAY